MATFAFKNLKFTNEDKASPVLDHIYYPFEKDGDKEAKVICRYMTNDEVSGSKYFRQTDTGLSIDSKKILIDKVVDIEGIFIEGENKKVPLTKELLLQLPFSEELAKFVAGVANHLMAGATLTKEEEKNLDLDTNASEKDSLSKKDAQ